MNNYKCEYGEIKKSGIYQSIYCKLKKGNCINTRYCPTRNGIEYSQNAQNCRIIIEKESDKNV